ncbi:MAG: 4-hydroxy-tetrahydrodipicolinate synthase [Sphaerochaetaceae bacterium]|jgi:4-hydroxy-tetrahydrodipicolinate synthase
MMKKGVYTALVTPFNKDFSIDYGAYEALIERQIAGGVAGIVPVGTTAESPTLQADEKEILIKKAVEVSKGRVTVIAGTGSNNTKETLEATKRAAEAGADMTMLVTPYYSKPSEEGLYRHFTSVAEAANLPVLLYNVPGRSALNLSVDFLLRLAEHPLIVAVKEASGNIGHILDLCARKKDSFKVFSGDDAVTLPLMALGGDGVVSVASNMFPKEMSELVDTVVQGDLPKAIELHNKMYPFFVNQFIESNPVPVKTYMAKHNLMEEVFRLPLCEMAPANKKTLLETF